MISPASIERMRLELTDLADAPALAAALQRLLPGLITTTSDGDIFIFYDPDEITVPDKRFPFCTIVTGDRYDSASNLDRDPMTYRVNVEASRDAYEERFGPAPRQPAGYAVIDTGHDYTATDAVLPHPFYAPLHWVCLRPGPPEVPNLTGTNGSIRGAAGVLTVRP
jgi:uncharacterized protein DUF6194